MRSFPGGPLEFVSTISPPTAPCMARFHRSWPGRYPTVKWLKCVKLSWSWTRTRVLNPVCFFSSNRKTVGKSALRKTRCQFKKRGGL